MADPDFDRIFAEGGAKDTIADVDYDGGWDDIAGALPPTKAEFNSLQNESDLKSKYLYDRLAPRENLLINGNFTVNQRGFVGGQPAAGVYGYDRWKGDTLGTRIEQVVENTETLSGSYTISWVGGTGTADVDGTTGLNSGDSVTMTATGNYSVIVPTDATNIKFEQGSGATPYQARLIGEEFALCQRYYQAVLTALSFHTSVKLTWIWNNTYATQMRDVPSAVVVNTSGIFSASLITNSEIAFQRVNAGAGNHTNRGFALLDAEL